MTSSQVFGSDPSSPGQSDKQQHVPAMSSEARPFSRAASPISVNSIILNTSMNKDVFVVSFAKKQDLMDFCNQGVLVPKLDSTYINNYIK